MLRIAVLGATGRMGMAIVKLIAAGPDWTLSGAATERGHALIGQDAGAVAGVGSLGVKIGSSAAAAVANCNVAIDFTTAAATAEHLKACRAANCALVLGTTGLSDSQMAELAAVAGSLPVVYGRNMSVGVFVLTELARQAARLIGPESDIEIIETHHRHKLDAPSGTALQVGEAVAGELGTRLGEVAVLDRNTTRVPRRKGSIGFSSVRAGSVVGDHEVMFALEEEILSIQHRALDRATFARGALRAARWVAGRSPGLYGMADVLGLAGRAEPG